MGSVCEVEPQDLVTFQLDSCLDYIKSGIQAIVDDEVTKRFCAEELKVSRRGGLIEGEAGDRGGGGA